MCAAKSNLYHLTHRGLTPYLMEFNVAFFVSTHRASVFLFGLTSVMTGAVFAQTTAPAPTMVPGAWSSNFQISLNGKDSTVLLQQVKMDLALSLPVGMREGVIASLNKTATRVRATTCISAETAAANSSPTALFTSLSKMNPRCSFKPDKLTSTTQYFSGRCDDPTAFTGYITGKVYIVSTSSWKGSFSGTGQVPDVALQALGLPPGSLVKMQSATQSNWVSPTCVAPTTTVATAP